VIPLDYIPDYDLLRDIWEERRLVAAEEHAARNAHADEVADGLLADPDFDPFEEWEDTC
jgi:hypothetical protein